jgi:hypothetical protein
LLLLFGFTHKNCLSVFQPSFCTTTTTQPTTGTNTFGQPAATGTAFGGFQTSQTVSALKSKLDLYPDCSNYSLGVKIGPVRVSLIFNM